MFNFRSTHFYNFKKIINYLKSNYKSSKLGEELFKRDFPSYSTEVI